VNLLKNKEKDAEVFYSLQPKSPEVMELLIPKEGEWPVVKEHLKKGEKKLIVIKLKRRHLKNQTVSLSCQENVVVVEKLSKEKMIEACKSKGKKLLPLKDNTVEMYTLKFDGGTLVYYVNKSDRTLQDKVSIDSKNVVINGEEKDFYEVLVKPETEFLLEIRVKDLFGDTKFHKESKVKMLKS